MYFLPGHLGIEAARFRRVSNFLPQRGLASQQERLGILPFSANLEGAKVLEPETFRRLRLRFPPDFESVEIVSCDFALANSVEQVFTQRRGQSRPLDPRHYSPKVMRASSSLRRF